MGIKIDENIDNAVTYDNPPEVERTLFKNLPEGGGGGVQDVQINGTSIVDANGDADIPLADNNNFGAVRGNLNNGTIITNGVVGIYSANHDLAKEGTNASRPITPTLQHESTFYGLAKAAGDNTQSASSNNVGQYTENAKNAIKTMLGISDYYERVTPLYIIWDSNSSSYIVYDPQGVTLDIPYIIPILRLITTETDYMPNFVEFSLIKSETTDPDYETTFNPITVLTFRSLEPTWNNKIVTITYDWYIPFEECTISVTTLS